MTMAVPGQLTLPQADFGWLTSCAPLFSWSNSSARPHVLGVGWRGQEEWPLCSSHLSVFVESINIKKETHACLVPILASLFLLCTFTTCGGFERVGVWFLQVVCVQKSIWIHQVLQTKHQDEGSGSVTSGHFSPRSKIKKMVETITHHVIIIHVISWQSPHLGCTWVKGGLLC